MCAGASGRVPPLSFEKLLLHFAQLCLSHGDFSSAIDTCQQLRERLAGKEERAGDTLLKHAFDLVWKAALTVERDKKTSSEIPEDPCHVAVGQCLDLREEAFSCLLTAREKNAVFAVDRIVKSSQHYQQMMMRGKSGKCSSFAVCYKRLNKFHSSLLTLCDLPSILPLSESFLCVDYLCLVAKVASYAGHTQQASLYLTKAKDVCHNLSDTVLRDTPHWACIHLTSALLHLNCVDTENEAELCACLSAAASEMETQVTGRPGSSHWVALWERSEELFGAMEERRVAMKREEERTAILPRESFPSLHSLATSHVQLAELRLHTRGGVAEHATRSSQLSVLNLVTQVLLSLLLLQEEYPDIETSRSSSNSCSSPKALPPSHKLALVESCLPVLMATQTVLHGASQDVLKDNEHRWLGNSAYNLGLALFRADLVNEACGVLQLACAELRVWCEAGQRESERAARWTEVDSD